MADINEMRGHSQVGSRCRREDDQREEPNGTPELLPCFCVLASASAPQRTFNAPRAAKSP